MTLEGSGGTAEVNQKSKRVKSMTFKEFVDMVNQFHDARIWLDAMFLFASSLMMSIFLQEKLTSVLLMFLTRAMTLSGMY